MNALVVGGASLIVTCGAMPLVRYCVVRWGWLDCPTGPLKPQSHAVPYGGGIAVAIGMGAVLLLSRLVLPDIPAVGALTVLLLGILDDVMEVHPRWRLAVGLLAGSTLFFMWPFGSSAWSSTVVAVACCAVLVSASMNAYNMTDGSDGLSGTVGLFAAGGLQVGWLLAGDTVLGSIAAASCGSIVGFLFFNWPPARVYLGDSGAYWMGFLLTALCVPALASWHAAVGVVCIMALLELELIASILRRTHGHQGLMGGDRRHIYDVLQVCMGLSATRVDVLYGVIGLVSSGIGVLVWRGAPAMIGVGWLAVLCILVVLLYRRSQTGRMAAI